MKRVKIIFETEKEGVPKRFGYIINQNDQSYITCQFNHEYEPSDISERHGVGDVTKFGQKIWRLIRYALKDNG
jgi:hypothetical protein